MTAILILGILNLGQLAIIYGLVNRLIIQAGHRPMQTPDLAPDAARNVKVEHLRVPAGSIKVTG